jgi:hypothetical protein
MVPSAAACLRHSSWHPAIVILLKDCSGELPQEIRYAVAAELKRRGAECVNLTDCKGRTEFRNRRLPPTDGWRACSIDNRFKKSINRFSSSSVARAVSPQTKERLYWLLSDGSRDCLHAGREDPTRYRACGHDGLRMRTASEYAESSLYTES